jgi:hypothetical protein
MTEVINNLVFELLMPIKTNYHCKVNSKVIYRNMGSQEAIYATKIGE